MAAVHTFRITSSYNTFCVGDMYMIFDMSFRSGVMNGIVLFGQVASRLPMNSFGFQFSRLDYMDT